MRYEPHNYQIEAEAHIVNNKCGGLFMEMGLGKTVVTLTAIRELIYGDMDVKKVIVVAPLKVAETVWTDERDKWDHLKHLKISLVLGDTNQRLAALKKPADIYIINRDNIVWLVTHYQSAWPFDMGVFDESSSFKNSSTNRFKAIRMVLPLMRRRIILTGTPSPNGLPDLWSQIYILDLGERLGKTISAYRQNYLVPEKFQGHVVYKYKVANDETKQLIYDKIGDICISMKAKDYLQLPELLDIEYKVKLPKNIMDKYTQFEETEVLTLLEEEGGDISAANAAALVNKLLQFVNGSIYQKAVALNGKIVKNVVHIHDEKLNALSEILEEAGDEPVLLFYAYQHDYDRLQKEFGFKLYEGPKDLVNWNSGKIKRLAAHPLSLAYGMNMQVGGRRIVWFGVPWSAELWLQGIARLHRQGQGKPVIMHKLVCPGTVDMQTVEAVKNKITIQDALMEAVKATVKRVKEKYHIA